MVPLHLGYLLHPQNLLPGFLPFFAVLNDMGELHFGHLTWLLGFLSFLGGGGVFGCVFLFSPGAGAGGGVTFGLIEIFLGLNET